MPFGYLFPVVLIGFCTAAASIGPDRREPRTAQHNFDLLFSLRYSYVIEAVAAFCDAQRI